MSSRDSRILFADVDGTLWCGSDSTGVLRERMAAAMRVARVVLASSRTLEELLALQDRLGIAIDVIAENGAQLAVRERSVADELTQCVEEPGDGRPLYVKHFADLLPTVLPDVTAAARRHGLEDALGTAPGWPGAPSGRGAPPPRRASLLLPRRLFAGGGLAAFVRDLTATGLDVVAGGEWVSIARGAHKGRAAQAYAGAVGRLDGAPPRTAAIGNSDNDASLIAAVERGFVIRNADGHAASLARLGNAVLLQQRGCAGWEEAIDLLQKEGPRWTTDSAGR